MLRALRNNLAAREHDLGQRVDSTVRYLSNIPPLLFEQTRLERDVQVAGQLYASLQQHYDEAVVADASALPDVRILAAPVQPYQPIGSVAPFLVIMAFLASGGLGVLGAVVIDTLDPRFRDPGHVTQGLGLRILGALPHLSRARNGEGTAQAIEAMRTVRVKLQHASNGGNPLLLTVTSPGVGEGKSLVSANLALAFAYAGLRTIVIDGDIRRGALHRLLRGSRRPGLTDHLTGRAPLDKVLQPTPYKGLSFIGCGSRMHNSPELLSAATMVDLLAALRSRYDVVLVDTAPLAAGADPARRRRRSSPRSGWCALPLLPPRRAPIRWRTARLPRAPSSTAWRGCSRARRRSGRRSSSCGRGSGPETFKRGIAFCCRSPRCRVRCSPSDSQRLSSPRGSKPAPIPSRSVGSSN